MKNEISNYVIEVVNVSDDHGCLVSEAVRFDLNDPIDKMVHEIHGMNYANTGEAIYFKPELERFVSFYCGCRDRVENSTGEGIVLDDPDFKAYMVCVCEAFRIVGKEIPSEISYKHGGHDTTIMVMRVA